MAQPRRRGLLAFADGTDLAIRDGSLAIIPDSIDSRFNFDDESFGYGGAETGEANFLLLVSFCYQIKKMPIMIMDMRYPNPYLWFLRKMLTSE